MGLDMFLNKVKREEVAYWRKANAIHAWFNRRFEEKADRELENCEDFYVTEQDLIDLKNDCKKVLESSKLGYKEVCIGERYNKETEQFEKIYGPGKVLEDTSVAEEILPTQNGFFFGSTLYSEDYIADLESTIKQIDEILETVDFEEYSIAYHAWW